MHKAVIVGCGYVGSYVGRLWLKKGYCVCAVTSSPERVAPLEAQGFEVVVADVLDPTSLERLPGGDVILYSVGPTGHRDVPRWRLYKEGLDNILTRFRHTTSQIGLVSSTGVYGNHPEGWIDEQTPRNPQRDSARALAAAEDLLLESSWGDRAYIFRLGGVYGPGRIPLVSQLVQGQPLPTSPDAMLNLIHVEDAATAIDLVISRGQPPCIVNVVDGFPVSRRDFYNELSRLLQVASPRFAESLPAFETDQVSSAARRHSPVTKRVSNQLLVKGFGMSLRYPDYRSGLAEIVRQGFSQ
ncbi:MAG TPA: NAD-dependent epimerase/dehydratase family protein [Thermogutta sp.]|nr:NAD-dependent epimerase/dehydratase family protein [Thermogutta sp.]HPU05335.1 NAD-dependent epimerase/dehydratase family protein [Thermogutta sp.]